MYHEKHLQHFLSSLIINIAVITHLHSSDDRIHKLYLLVDVKGFNIPQVHGAGCSQQRQVRVVSAGNLVSITEAICDT